MYFWLANLVALIHGTVVITVIVGAMAAIIGVLRRRPRLEAAYYALFALVILSDFLLGECFLTGLEKHLRELHQPGSAYRGSFIGHYFPFVPRFVHAWIGPALVVGAIAAFPFWRWVEWRRQVNP